MVWPRLEVVHICHMLNGGRGNDVEFEGEKTGQEDCTGSRTARGRAARPDCVVWIFEEKR